MPAAAAVVFVAVLAGLGGFQIALACGAPWGRFAWGGQHDGVLPRGFRIGSAIALVVYLVLAVVVLDRAEVIDVLDDTVAYVGAWIAFGFSALSVLPNAVSRSRAERFTMTPVTLVLAVTGLLVALG